MLEKIYFVLFFIGVIYTGATFFLGGLFDMSDLDFDSIELPGESHFSLPIKPYQIIIFITSFGGSGIILLKSGFIWWVTILLSFCIGIVFVFFINKFIYQPLLRSQTIVKKQSAAIGLNAEVLEKIPEDGFGRIRYTVSGNILSAVAVSNKKGVGIPKGAAVIITDIENNTYYVTELIELYKNY